MDEEKEHPFDILFTRNVPHIPEKIFLYLDLESFKTCLKVNKVWNNFIMNDSYQRKAASLFREELLRDEEKLLRDRVRYLQKAQCFREILGVFLAFLLVCMSFSLLIKWILPSCGVTARWLERHSAINYLIYLYRGWLSFTAYKSRWDKRFTTREYKRRTKYVYRNGILKEDKLGLETVNRKILKDEEKLRQRKVGYLRGEALFLLCVLTLWLILFIVLRLVQK